MSYLPLIRIWEARDAVLELEDSSDKLPSAREALAEAVSKLLTDIAWRDADEQERVALDVVLAPRAAELKGALLKALRVCGCARGFLGLPRLMEETRKLLTAAPAKGVATYLEDALCADVAACEDARALAAVVDVMGAMLGQGRLKKDLGGFDLAAPHKKSVRTALNRASKRLGELEAARAQQEREASAAARPPPKYEMERDVRLDDAEDAAARDAARERGLEELFSKASIGDGAASSAASPGGA